jgi:23S rRNA (uracil1939-C5)-methyltransferase
MQVRIEKLVYGGAGLARTERGVVFVPRTAPGDVVEVEISRRKADYAVGRIVSLIEPSPDRQDPDCPNYETAGCCHWQHIRYGRQLEIKEEILRETLKRIGGIDWDDAIRIIRSPDRNYRLRATFHVHHRQVGFVVEGTHIIVPIRECSSLTPELNDFIPRANALLASPEMASAREVRALSDTTTVTATFVSDKGELSHHQIGTGVPRIEASGFRFELHPDAFSQSNRYVLGSFIEEVLDQAGASPRRVLDLFCGIGFFSIPLARRAAEVVGVESNPIALRQASVNARLNGIDNVRFFRGKVESTLRTAAVRPDLVVLNPPRMGCGRDTAGEIANLRANRIVYVSCNPSTFAQEAAVLITQGYSLRTLTLLDQFPNTHHIELVATFDAA